MKTNMKQPVLILSFLAICQFSFGQNKAFEGIVKYRTITTSYIHYDDTIGSETDTTYSSIYHKDGNYVVIELNSNEKQVFLRKRCKIYVLPADGSDIQVFPGASQELVSKVDSLIGRKEILGYTCKGISLITASTVYTAYFSPIHFTNPLGLKNCNFWNVEFLNDKIPFYSLMEETGSYKLEMTAFDLIPGPVDDGLFVLPKDTPNDFIQD